MRRSESVRQALLDSHTDSDQDDIEQSSSVVLEFLDDLHHLGTFTQRTKKRATELVDELGKLPGMLKSSTLESSILERMAHWLISLVSDTYISGTTP